MKKKKIEVAVLEKKAAYYRAKLEMCVEGETPSGKGFYEYYHSELKRISRRLEMLKG